MTQRPTPDVGGLLAGFMAQVPEAARPRFLALLERGAAVRYRYWAEQLPAHAEGLRACAAREEEIAARAERVVPNLALTENPDILAAVAALPKPPFCVGFAAETSDLDRNARDKLERKKLALIVANIGPATFAQDDNSLLLVDAHGELPWSPVRNQPRQHGEQSVHAVHRHAVGHGMKRPIQQARVIDQL